MLNCVWNITAEEGHFIEITFDDFEVEGPRNDVCTFDYVSIQQGKDPFTLSVSRPVTTLRHAIILNKKSF